MDKTLKLSLGAVAVAVSVLSASAQAIFFNDQAAFLAANPGLALQSFNGICPDNNLCPGTNFTGFTVAAANPNVAGTGFNGSLSGYLIDNTPGGLLNLIFNPDITAVGFNLSGSATGVGNLTVTLFDAANMQLATQQLIPTNPIPQFNTFAGFSGVGTIDRVLVTTNGAGELVTSIDNLRFGTPTPGGVPEPASLALLGLGLAGLGVFRRRT